VVVVGNRADRRAAFNADAADFTGTQTHLSILAFTGDQLSVGTSSTSKLSALTREEFDAANRRTNRNIAERQAVANLDLSFGTVHQLVASLQALRGDDVAAFAVSEQHESDMSGTVRIVFETLDAGGNAVLVTNEVDDTISTLVAATLMTSGDVTVVVTAVNAVLLFGQSSERLALMEFRVNDLDHVATSSGRRLHADESHYFTSCAKLMS